MEKEVYESELKTYYSTNEILLMRFEKEVEEIALKLGLSLSEEEALND